MERNVEVIWYSIRKLIWVSSWVYAKDFGWHNILYLGYGYELEPYESSVKYYAYIYTLMWWFANTCYLLFILWHAMVLVLVLEIIHWAYDSLTPPFISPPRCESIWPLLDGCCLILFHVARWSFTWLCKVVYKYSVILGIQVL